MENKIRLDPIDLIVEKCIESTGIVFTAVNAITGKKETSTAKILYADVGHRIRKKFRAR